MLRAGLILAALLVSGCTAPCSDKPEIQGDLWAFNEIDWEIIEDGVRVSMTLENDETFGTREIHINPSLKFQLIHYEHHPAEHYGLSWNEAGFTFFFAENPTPDSIERTRDCDVEKVQSGEMNGGLFGNVVGDFKPGEQIGFEVDICMNHRFNGDEGLYHLDIESWGIYYDNEHVRTRWTSPCFNLDKEPFYGKAPGQDCNVIDSHGSRLNDVDRICIQDPLFRDYA